MDSVISTNPVEQLRDMLRAYYPVIYMTTFEYDRAKQKISGVAKSLNKGYGIYEWNSVNGLVQNTQDGM